MFSIFESSRYKSKPFYLLMIRYGAGVNDFYAFTDGEFPFTKGGVTYVTRQFDLPEISANGSLDRSTVELRTPKNNELFELFRVYPPSYRVTLSIMKSHFGDSDSEVVTIWSGRIVNMTVRGVECTFSCDPIATAMRRLGLRRNWQYGCPHALYQGSCRADRNAVKQVATVISNSAATLTLTPNWNGSIPPEKFVGGVIEIPGSTVLSRTVLRVSGDAITVAGAISEATPGVQISLYPGCSHTMEDCQSVHNNIVNFGGQSWIPTDNPVGAKNNFY